MVDQARHRVSAYNRTAARVWDAWMAGLTADQIATYAAGGRDNHDNSVDIARRQIHSIIEHWQREGMLPGGQTENYSPFQAKPPIALPCGTSEQKSVQTIRWMCKIGPLVVSFVVEPKSLVPNVRTLLRPFEIAEATPDIRLEIRYAGDDAAVVLDNGQERVRARLCEPGAFKEAAHRAILERLYPVGNQWLPAVHAGAMTKAGTTIIFPALSGSGKTTLIAFLMTQGYRYLADDFVAFAPPEGKVLPWPLPLSIKSGSFDIVKRLHPDFSDAYAFRTKGDTARLLVPPADCWTSAPTQPSCLVFPQFDPTAKTNLRPVEPLETFQRILEAGVWLGYPLRRRNVETFLGWIAALPKYTLNFSSLEAARECLDALNHQV